MICANDKIYDFRMSNFDISVAQHVRENTNMDNTIKDKWPSSGMCYESRGVQPLTFTISTPI